MLNDPRSSDAMPTSAGQPFGAMTPFGTMPFGTMPPFGGFPWFGFDPRPVSTQLSAAAQRPPASQATRQEAAQPSQGLNSGKAPLDTLSALPEVAQKMMTAMTQGQAPIARAITQSTAEMQRLVGQRSQAYLELGSKLAQCRSPFDVMALQMQFWQTAAQAYTQSAQRLVAPWSQVSPLASSLASMNPWMQMGAAAGPAQSSALNGKDHGKPQRDRMAVTPQPADAAQASGSGAAPSDAASHAQSGTHSKPDTTGDGRRAA